MRAGGRNYCRSKTDVHASARIEEILEARQTGTAHLAGDVHTGGVD